jgi:hypothetical protein
VGPSDAEIKYGNANRQATVSAPAPEPSALSRPQMRALARQPLPPSLRLDPPPRPFLGRVANEPWGVGVDASLDTGMNFQIAAVLRHLDGTRFRAGTVIVDFLHEPTLSATVSLDPRPGHFGTAVGLFSLTALNLHFQRHGHDLVELALGQMGVGLDGRGNPVFGAGAQAEIHSDNPHFSIFINSGGTLATDADGRTQWTWSPISFGLLFHVLNP